MNKRIIALSLLCLLLPLLMLVVTPKAYAVNVPIGTPGHYIDEGIGDPQTIDPAWAYDTASAGLINLVYDPLIRFDREHQDAYIPCLSTVVPSLDNGYIQNINERAPHGLFNFTQRITFPIRTGVSFHKGEPLTPADVEYSFERWLVMDRTGGPQWMMFEPVQGIGNYANFYLTDDPDVQAQIIEDAFQVQGNNFIMNLAERYPPILGILAQSWGSIVCRSYFINTIGDFDDDWSHWTDWYNPPTPKADARGHLEDGTGPFSKDYWTVGVEYSVVRNPSYWSGWPAYSQGDIYEVPQASSYLNRFTERVVYEWGTRRADFIAGTCDTAYVPRQFIVQVIGQTGIRCLKDIPQLIGDANFFNFNVDPASPYVGTGVLGSGGIPLNFFSDKNIRLAFAYAFNYTKFIHEVILDEAVQPSSPIIEGIRYHDPSTPLYSIDLNKARDYFQAASDTVGGPAEGVMTKGFYFKMTYNTGNQPRQVTCDFYKNYVHMINPNFVIQTVGVTWATYLGELNWYPSGRSIMPVFQIGWLADYPDAHNWAYPFMASTGDFSFPQSYSNSTVDALIKEGISAPELPPDQPQPQVWSPTLGKMVTRGEIYEVLQMMYYQDVPSVMIDQPLGRRWERDWVQGWYYNTIEMPNMYTRWEGLNGDINGPTLLTPDGTVDSLDWTAIISVCWYTPSLKLGPYRPYADFGPWPHFVVGQLPPPGTSVGAIDTAELAVLNGHWKQVAV